MFLVLCSSIDVPAHWAGRGLQALGLEPLSVVTTEVLSSATQWEHRVSSMGECISFTLADGCIISDQSVRGVLNRLVAPAANHLNRTAIADRNYAHQELAAFYLSWLNSLSCPVVNQPTPQGLAGRFFHASEWTLLAGQAGLAVMPYRQNGNDLPGIGYKPLAPLNSKPVRVVVFGGQVFGFALPDSVQSGCCELATRSGTALLEIEFYATADHRWTFSSATPVADLTIGGTPLLQSIGRFLQSGAAQ